MAYPHFVQSGAQRKFPAAATSLETASTQLAGKGFQCLGAHMMLDTFCIASGDCLRHTKLT
jgi:hypothetical protein